MIRTPRTEAITREQMIVEKIIAGLIRDIRGRQGLGDQWDGIDVDVRAEIRSDWRKLIAAALSAPPQEPEKFKCDARYDPEACRWPLCECDPAVERMKQGLAEQGFTIAQEPGAGWQPIDENTPTDNYELYLMRAIGGWLSNGRWFFGKLSYAPAKGRQPAYYFTDNGGPATMWMCVPIGPASPLAKDRP